MPRRNHDEPTVKQGRRLVSIYCHFPVHSVPSRVNSNCEVPDITTRYPTDIEEDTLPLRGDLITGVEVFPPSPTSSACVNYDNQPKVSGRQTWVASEPTLVTDTCEPSLDYQARSQPRHEGLALHAYYGLVPESNPEDQPRLQNELVQNPVNELHCSHAKHTDEVAHPIGRMSSRVDCPGSNHPTRPGHQMQSPLLYGLFQHRVEHQ